MDGELIDATLDNFSEFENLDRCVAVFHKKLCPNCKILMKVIAKIKAQAPQIKFIAIDSETETGLMERYGVTRVPTLICLQNGKAMTRHTGIMNPKEMLALIGSNF